VRPRCGALLLVLWAAVPVRAEPPKVPTGPVVAPVGGRPQVVTVEVPKEFGMAPAFSPEDCLLFPGESDASGRKVYLVQPYRPGVYRAVFWTKGETAYSTLVIDASGAAPTPPGPKPPDPVPPVDPLTKALRDAYATEAAADRGVKVGALARAMRDGAGFARDTTLATNAALTAKVSQRTQELVGAGTLPAVRKAIGAHLASAFPTTVFDLTADRRDQFAAEYAKIAAALEGLE
jgi:hypothetical protein